MDAIYYKNPGKDSWVSGIPSPHSNIYLRHCEGCGTILVFSFCSFSVPSRPSPGGLREPNCPPVVLAVELSWRWPGWRQSPAWPADFSGNTSWWGRVSPGAASLGTWTRAGRREQRTPAATTSGSSRRPSWAWSPPTGRSRSRRASGRSQGWPAGRPGIPGGGPGNILKILRWKYFYKNCLLSDLVRVPNEINIVAGNKKCLGVLLLQVEIHLVPPHAVHVELLVAVVGQWNLGQTGAQI